MRDEQVMQDYISRLRREHEIYAELASTLTSSLNHSEILESIMRLVGTLLRPRNWSLLLMDQHNAELYFEIVVGEGAELIKGQRLKLGEGIAGWAAKTGESVLIKDVREDPRFCRRFDQICNFYTKSVICVPLRNGGKTLGAIELVNRIEHDAFTDLDMKALQNIAQYAAIAINNAHLYRKAHRLALTDDHTCLFNIRCLYEALERELASAKSEQHEVSIIFFDLDHFKDVVDTHGHLRASKMLREVGLLIKDLTRPNDIPVRYGGDEFVILMPKSGKSEALEFAGRLRERLNSRCFLSEERLDIRITASFGVATYPEDAKDEGELLKLADGAMYNVKESTRNGIMTVLPPK